MNIPLSAGERLPRPLERLTPNPKLKCMEQCREVMRFHRLALRTEECAGFVLDLPCTGGRFG
jgi:hypothetical protein